MGKSGKKVHAIFSYTICNFSEILKLFPNKKLQSKRKKEALLALQSVRLVVTTPDSAFTGGWGARRRLFSVKVASASLKP